MSQPQYEGPNRRRKPDAATEAAIERAVAAGIRAAVSDPEVWNAASVAMKARAQNAAGGILLGGLRVVLGRVLLILAVMVGIYALGGPVAVLSFLKAQATQ